MKVTTNNFSLEQRKKVKDAEAKRDEYNALEKKIVSLKIEDLKNRNKAHSLEITNLSLQLSKLKQELNEKTYEAAKAIGIY
ncbi:hypothetical protein [Clostridium beijerinckii]|jgi:hypothetical protein|uniref:Uncharacterized protein n=2 Tax=Clostridium beijerinckii TaxID=1520 RepID=A0AAE2RMR1_CLOBE|nr:hypothetical protein [Clostridium beijerinckii]ABR37099.1 hypothetical protein Cbei_4993 [Clostridium beijerinckii NCIMB 8052]AIU05209.1 hypothetical protein Cbs_4993 [Clostridium beijerinckii ATCC 35702]MBF7808250.1 hypothetical protein [Clostridium beijerinckii]NRT21818.1 hypothetical protein [Clostridium beijerinckii]NRT65676.1 hypothetical protein [Clostridium beijerinckii]